MLMIFMYFRFLLYPHATGAAIVGFSLSLLMWFSGCAWKGPHSEKPMIGPHPKDRFSIMAFNTQNLFDAERDRDRNDFVFLPRKIKKSDPAIQAFCKSQPKFRQNECFRLDWTDEVVQHKLKAVASAILQVYGEGPDILVLVEIENEKILRRLNQELKTARYQTVVWKPSSDPRGISVGLLSRFPLAGIPTIYPGVEGSRGFLFAPLRLNDDSVLNVFGVHLPSQLNPTARRIESLRLLKERLHQLPQQSKWVVAGDWNISARENREHGLVSRVVRSWGQVSHIIGCTFCSGTHFYRGEWDFLDILVFSENLNVDTESIRTPAFAPTQVDKRGRPLAFHPKKFEGISDHLPIYAEVITESKTSKQQDRDRRYAP